MTEPVTVVLVHGAWHGPWCWDRVTPLLDGAGIAWRAVDRRLPPDRALVATTVADNVALTRAVLEECADRPVVLVGHSAGGRVVTWSTSGFANVVHLVYLAAFMPGGEVPERPNPAVNDALRFGTDGSFDIRPEAIYPLFYGPDTGAADAVWAAAQLVPQAGGERSAPPPDGAVLGWRNTPSTYAVCRLDNAIPLAQQEAFAAQATDVVRWDTGHSPFLTRPGEVADLLIGLATRYAT